LHVTLGINKLNSFEMCLLVDALVQQGKTSEATKIAELIKL